MHGLYGLMVVTPIAGLTLSSQFIWVANTSAISGKMSDVVVDDELINEVGENIEPGH